MKRIPTKPRRMWALVRIEDGEILGATGLRKWARQGAAANAFKARVEPVWVKPERRKGRKG